MAVARYTALTIPGCNDFKSEDESFIGLSANVTGEQMRYIQRKIIAKGTLLRWKVRWWYWIEWPTYVLNEAMK